MTPDQKIIVVVDSNLMKRDKTFSTSPMLLLKELSVLGIISLNFPWFIFKECSSESIAKIEEEVDQAISNLNRLDKHGLHSKEAAIAKDMGKTLTAFKTSIKFSVEQRWHDFITEAKATLIPFDPTDSTQVFENYFSGGLPFTKLKSRNDIPDAFIFETLKKLAVSAQTHFVTGDKAFRDKCDGEANIVTHEDLETLFKSEKFKPALDRHEQIKHYEQLKATLLTRLEGLEKEIEDKFINEVVNLEIENRYFPSDNNDATIAGVEYIEEVNVGRDEINFVEDTFYIPISVVAFCNVDFFIYKSDYYSMGDERNIYTEDWNDHYFLAQESVTLKFSFELKVLKEELVDDLEFSIPLDEFDEIAVKEGQQWRYES